MATWPLHHAEAHLGDLLEKAETAGPQIIVVAGAERAVVLSINTYRKLAGEAASEASAQKQYVDFKDWLLNGPQLEDDDPFFYALQETRKDLGRQFEFEDE